MTIGDPITSNPPHRPEIVFAFFGTSIMEHFEAHYAGLDYGTEIPPPGTLVRIDGWRKRGWVYRLQLALQASRLDLDHRVCNHGLSGATSRDVLEIVRKVTATEPPAQIAIVSCGINDVWRGYQGQTAEHVDAAEYLANYRSILDLLRAWAGQVLALSETPFGAEVGEHYTLMNEDLDHYNALAASAARDVEVPVVDVWTPVLQAGSYSDRLPWNDGAHLTDLGDSIMARTVEDALHRHGLLETCYDIVNPRA